MATTENHQEVVRTLAGSIRACLNALSDGTDGDDLAAHVNTLPSIVHVEFPCICLSLTQSTVSLTKVSVHDDYYLLKHLLLDVQITPDMRDKRLVSHLHFARHESDRHWLLCDLAGRTQLDWLDRKYVLQEQMWHALAGSTIESSEDQLYFNCIVKQLLTQDTLDDISTKSLIVIVPESKYVTCVNIGLNKCTQIVGRTVTHKDHVRQLLQTGRVIVCHETHLLYSLIRTVSRLPLPSQQLHFVEGLRKHICGVLALDKILEIKPEGIDPTTAYAIGIVSQERPTPAGYYFFPDREAAMRDALVLYAVRYDNIVYLAIMRKKAEVLQAQQRSKTLKCSLDRTNALVERYRHVLEDLMRATDQ